MDLHVPIFTISGNHYGLAGVISSYGNIQTGTYTTYSCPAGRCLEFLQQPRQPGKNHTRVYELQGDV